MIALGVIDSIGILKLVTFLEERFDINLEPHEIGKEHLNTLDEIVELVRSKLSLQLEREAR